MKNLMNQIMKGEKCDKSSHEQNIFETTLELIDVFEIEFDADNLIQNDENIADRVFWAAVELLEKVGIYSSDAKKVFKVPRNEILSSIRNARNGIFIGENIDKKFFGSRNVYKNQMPMIMGGPASSPISDELFIPIHRSYVKLNSIDSIAPGKLHSFDYRITNNNPFHLDNAHKSIDYLKRSCKLEARAGLCIVTPPFIEDTASAISITHPRFMDLGDLQEIIVGTNLQVTYDELLRTIHYHETGFGYMCTDMVVMDNDTTAEQFAIKQVVEALKSKLIYQPSIHYKYPSHIESAPSGSLETLWASFIASMALSRNTDHLKGTVVQNSAGPCTEMAMYETAIQTIGCIVCGDDTVSGPMLNRGSMVDHSAGLDALFMAEISKLATKLSINDANYLCLQLYDTYKSFIDQPNAGQSFVDCYDVETIEPNREYEEIYEKVMDTIYGLISSRYSRKSPVT